MAVNAIYSHAAPYLLEAIMGRYIIKRLLALVFVFIGVNFIVFTIMYLSPSDPASIILGVGATPESIEMLKAQLGLNDPFIVQYLRNLKGLFTLNFGNSYVFGLPVLGVFLSRFPITLNIAVGSMIFAIFLGVPLGVLSSVKQYSIFDYIGVFFSLLLSAVPAFWFGLMLMRLFSVQLHLLPASGVENIKSYILPIFTAGITNAVIIMRLTRSTMLEVIRQDYICTIRAKGAPEWYVIFKHALKNALLPVVTIIGMRFGVMLGGIVVIETVFAIPGVGTMLVEAVRTQDVPTVMIGVTLFAFTFCLVNLLIDILYAYLDPRIRANLSS